MLVSHCIAIFLAPGLLLMVEPLFRQQVPPVFGGAVSGGCGPPPRSSSRPRRSAGYAYAHLAVGRLGVRRQSRAHLLVLGLPLLVLPLGVSRAGAPPAASSPVPWLLFTMLVTAGSPFFALSAAGLLLQLARGDGPLARGDPYFLYAASNLGSMAALLAYPTLIESQRSTGTPVGDLGLATTARFVVTQGGLRVQRARRAAKPSAPRRRWARPHSAKGPQGPHTPGSFGPPPAAGSSSWSGASASRFCEFLAGRDHAPDHGTSRRRRCSGSSCGFLGIHFLLHFSSSLSREKLSSLGTQVRRRAGATRAALGVTAAHGSIWGLVGILLFAILAALFVVSMACHGELARDRPPPARLTAFLSLSIALGGAPGGVFRAPIAPPIFLGR